MNHSCLLTALGVYTPEHRLTNAELCTMVDTSDEWITSRTGIRSRRRLAPEESTATMGLAAAKRALQSAGVQPQDLSHIIVATCTPDKLCPSTACIIAGSLGAPSCMAFDINAACSGYLYGVSLCRSILAGQPDATILFIAAEAMTRRMNWNDRSTCVLFGDGATASIFSATAAQPLAQVRDVLCDADCSLHSLITIGGGAEKELPAGQNIQDDFFLQMQGREVFKHAVRRMAEACKTLLERNGLTIHDIDLLVPHQANMRIIEAVGSRLGIEGSKVFANVEQYGNTSAASVPLALSEALQAQVLSPGKRVLCVSFGAGLTWSALLLDF